MGLSFGIKDLEFAAAQAAQKLKYPRVNGLFSSLCRAELSSVLVYGGQ